VTVSATLDEPRPRRLVLRDELVCKDGDEVVFHRT
jgi:hypothetical protein